MKSSLQIVDRFLLMPSMLSNARFAQNGELFARLKLVSDISEDTLQGRLILQNVFTVLLAPSDKKKQQQCGSKVRKHTGLDIGYVPAGSHAFLRLSGQSSGHHNLFSTGPRGQCFFFFFSASYAAIIFYWESAKLGRQR